MKIVWHPGDYFARGVDWLVEAGDAVFGAITTFISTVIDGMESGLMLLPVPVMILILALLAWYLRGLRRYGLALFTVIAFSLIAMMELWAYTMATLALVLSSTSIALVIGVPMGILTGRSDRAENIGRPILDFMQTMPAFVYLIPAVLFFQLGKVPGAMATVVFAMPPSVRLTCLGLRQVPAEVMEAAQSFGATPAQQLGKVQLPMALPNILAGINQTIMLSLSMVVIAAMIGAGGLGEQVLRGITQLRIGLGFESGLAVVFLAMYLDRVTQAMGTRWGNIAKPRK